MYSHQSSFVGQSHLKRSLVRQHSRLLVGFPCWSKNPSFFINQFSTFAGETFAIETQYGRARCVRQWGNSEHTIMDAIAACPVNCIHMVERQKLPALEYVMAQLPRHGVGVEVHSGGGLKRGNVDVFQVGFGSLEEL